jgi:hypothetical protein
VALAAKNTRDQKQTKYLHKNQLLKRMKPSLLAAFIILLLLTNGCAFLTKISNDETSAVYPEDKIGYHYLGGGSVEPIATTVTLQASTDFRCTMNWVNQQEALNLVPSTDEGACLVEFSGVTSRYQIRILIQTEFTGKPVYTLSRNGKTIFSGQYPLSNAKGCDCPQGEWPHCPDQIVEIDAGIHTITTGDSLEFYGKEDPACGNRGATAKWREITFTPAW